VWCTRAMRSLSRTLLVLLVAACSTALPSEQPLGTGPLAVKEQEAERARLAKLASEPSGDGASAEAEPSTPPPSEPIAVAPTPTAEPTASVDAGTTADAGKTPAAPAGAGKVDFAGEYSGKDKAVIRPAGLPEQVQDDPNAKTSVKNSPDGNIKITIVASNSGDPLCTLTAKPKGTTAALTAGEQCPEKLNPFFNGRVKSGLATLNGKQLVVELTFEFEIDLPPGGKVQGTIEYRFDGTRK
jgi:hypothetical protein